MYITFKVDFSDICPSDEVCSDDNYSQMCVEGTTGLEKFGPKVSFYSIGKVHLISIKGDGNDLHNLKKLSHFSPRRKDGAYTRLVTAVFNRKSSILVLSVG